MPYGIGGRVWGLEPWVDQWLASRWQYITNCVPLAAVQINAAIANDCVDPTGAPGARIEYTLAARYGNIAVWEINSMKLAITEPSDLAGIGCGVYDASLLDWNLSEYSTSITWGDPLCALGSMYLEDGRRLVFMTVKPEMLPGRVASECWEYVVALRQAPHDMDPEFWLTFLLDVHQPDMSHFGGITAMDFFHTYATAETAPYFIKRRHLV